MSDTWDKRRRNTDAAFALFTLEGWHQALGMHPQLGVYEFEWAPRFRTPSRLAGAVGAMRWTAVESQRVAKAEGEHVAGPRLGWEVERTPAFRALSPAQPANPFRFGSAQPTDTRWVLLLGFTAQGDLMTSMRSPQEIVAELAQLLLTPYPYQE